MLEIAEFIAPGPTPRWRLAKLAGVDVAVGGLPFDDLPPGEGPCDLARLTRLKARHPAAGFRLAVIESRPPLNLAKRGLPGRFEETWHDVGKTDMLARMKACRDNGFDGVMRPDHVPTVEGDSNAAAGYSSFGRLHALGDIRGRREAVHAD